MNKEEINKILSRLERIDHKEYSCSFEFADSGSFEETCMCFDERKKLAKYIQELQQENKQLKDNWNKLKNIAKSQSDFKQKLGNDRVYFEIDELLDKMQELEKSDSNE